MKSVIEVQLPEDGVNEVDMPKGGELLTVAVGGGFNPALFVRGDRDAPKERRKFYVARQALDDVAGKYVGSAQAPSRAVLHVFEVEEEAKKKK